MTNQPGAPQVDISPSTDEVVTWWGLVIEGYANTQRGLMGEIEDRFALAPPQFDILIRLLRTADYRMPMTKLAREAALSSGGFTKVADRLARIGLIQRVRCDDDRRVIYAELTERGRVLAEEAREVCAQILRRRLVEPLGPAAALTVAESMRVLREANADT